MPQVYVSVGSNLGERETFLALARKEILSAAGITDLRCSPVYETEPVEAAGGKYLNAVWSFETALSPEALLGIFHEIERKAGRVRKVRNEPRSLDLDLLFYGERVIRTEALTVPHPRIHERAFVLEPMAELAPDFMHPVLRKTVRELLKVFSDKR